MTHAPVYIDELETLVLDAEGVTRVAQEGRSAQKFSSVDPLAEQFPGYAPYNYVMNNPVNMIDPDGMAPCGPGDGCPSAAGSSKKRFRIRLPIRTTSKFKTELRTVATWESSPSTATRGSANGTPTMTHEIPESLEGQREGDVVSVETDPKTKLTVGGEDGSGAGHAFDAEVSDGATGAERPLYATPEQPNAGANPGDKVTVTPQSRPGDANVSGNRLARLQNRRMGRLKLSMTVRRERVSVTHTRKLFGVVPVGKTTRAVPEGRNPR